MTDSSEIPFSTSPVSEISAPIESLEDEKLTDVEQQIKTAANLYKQGEYLQVVNFLSDYDSPCAKKYDIDIRRPLAKVYADSEDQINDRRSLTTAIYRILRAGHGPTEDRLELADCTAEVGSEELPPEKIPPLWRKVQALCFLEEWIHLSQNIVDAANEIDRTNPDYDFTKQEIDVAIYFHDKLGIKLPRYFMEQYDRQKLNIPIEDHDFDDIDMR